MIYIDENTEQLVLPKYFDINKELKLEVENNLTHQAFSFGDLHNTSDNKFYYVFDINITLPVGEYTYKLFSGNTLLETGLLTYGDYTPEHNEYTENKTYTGYEG